MSGAGWSVRERMIAALDADARELGDDELRVLTTMARRLVHGRAQYGDLCIDSDPREWRKEAGEEALDLSIYLAIQLLKRA